MVMLPPLQLADAVANAASFDLLPFNTMHCCWFSIVLTLTTPTAACCHYCHHQQFTTNSNYFIAVAHMAVTVLSLLIVVTAFAIATFITASCYCFL